MGQHTATVRVLVNNYTAEGPWLAEHGAAFWLDLVAGERQYHLLFDAGQSGQVLSHNARAFKLDWTSLDAIALSHGHADHTGGVLEALRLCGRRVPVIHHPDALLPKLKTTPMLRQIGIPFRREELEGAGCLLGTHEPVTIMAGVQTSGEIPRKTRFEQVEGFQTLRQGRVEPDEVLDDLSLFMALPDAGLVVLSGCAHAGIINIVQHGLALTGAGRLAAVIGGFHLRGASADRIQQTIEALRALAPEVIVPLHCTGDPAEAALRQAFGTRVQRACVGSEFHFTSGYPTAP